MALKKMFPYHIRGRFCNRPGETGSGLSTFVRMCFRALWHGRSGASCMRPWCARRGGLGTSCPKPSIVWIGHATFLIQLAGFTVITDPVFGSISRMFARILEPGIALQNLPKIDAILISHNHRDHMDEKSLLALKAANPLVAVYVPLGNGEWFTRRGFAQVHECTWWESHTVGVASDVQVHCLPAIHWSRRGMFDRNKALWSSWLIKSPESTIYFAGDTAYGPHFKTIGESFKPIDMALMPIGPCEPHELMRHSHVSPEEAVRACADLQASVMIPMHWGTFKLGCDEPLDPLHRLRNVWRNSPELVAGKRCLVRPCGSVISLPIPPDISVETDLIASYSQADH